MVEPAPLVTVAERIERKGGRELLARCPSKKDAREAADRLVDRFSRLVPGLPVVASVDGSERVERSERQISTPDVR
ncbi:hypothetical protein [Micromonospora sp. NPDC049799]|uniref:hypothetical protein n=1 Tax=Micromonospora sp. NPDC049799 TaxID=3154741 RepID=UPI0033E723BB